MYRVNLQIRTHGRRAFNATVAAVITLSGQPFAPTSTTSSLGTKPRRRSPVKATVKVTDEPIAGLQYATYEVQTVTFALTSTATTSGYRLRFRNANTYVTQQGGNHGYLNLDCRKTNRCTKVSS
jgi:hypothetical protein